MICWGQFCGVMSKAQAHRNSIPYGNNLSPGCLTSDVKVLVNALGKKQRVAQVFGTFTYEGDLRNLTLGLSLPPVPNTGSVTEAI